MLPPLYVKPNGWAILEIHSADGIPDCDAVFTNANNDAVGMTFAQAANCALHIVDELLSVNLDRGKFKSHQTYLKFCPLTYRDAILSNSLPIIIIRSVLGWMRSGLGDVSMDTFASSQQSNPEQSALFRDQMETLAMFIFEYKLPHEAQHTLWNQIHSRTLKTAEGYFKNKSRTKYPLWSYDYIESIDLRNGDSALCKGHNYDYLLVVDCFVKGLYAKIRKDQQDHVGAGNDVQVFLTADQAAAMFDENEGLRLWDAAGRGGAAI
jgi:hypothetical protein